MFEDICKTGDVAAIVVMFAAAKISRRPKYGGGFETGVTFTIEGDCTERDRLDRERAEAMAAAHLSDRQRTLCYYQQREYGLGCRTYRLGTNMYGWAAGDTMASNIGGGRWACTSRGDSLEDVIRFAAKQCERKNTRFEVHSDRLPEDVRAALLAELLGIIVA